MKRLISVLAVLSLLLISATAYAENAGDSLKSPSSFDEQCLDQYGQPTLYAVLELTGPEFVRLLEEQGYAWYEKDEILRGFRRTILLPGETISQIVKIRTSDEFYSDIWAREKYDSATEKGGAAAGQVIYEAAGYGTGGDWGVVLEDVVGAFVNVDIVDQITDEDLRCVFLKVRDSSGREYIVTVTEDGKARSGIQIDSDISLATTTPATTVEKDWKAICKMYNHK